MKKLVIGVTSFAVIFTIFACIILSQGSNSNSLYLLNWGEYIDETLLEKFEEETGIKVIEETVTSSETMYQKISAGTTSYDVAIPGDYMITKLYNEGYLKKIDVNNDEYNNFSNYQTMFTDDLMDLRKEYMSDTLEYTMPYFWGAYSIVYNNQKSETKEVIQSNGLKALYDRSLYSNKVQIGMYNTARWTVSSYLMANGLDPNSEDFNQSEMVNGIKNASFDVWGDDQLKRKTATGDLDMCYTQLGDFFDAVYLGLDEGLGGNVGLDNLKFNVYVPQTTAAFFDGMVIPSTSKNTKAANKFINFMLDPDNAFQNALAIGYSPTLKSVCQRFIDNPEEEYFSNDLITVTVNDLINKYPMYLNPLVNSKSVYMLEPKNADYMTLCETIVNQAKGSFGSESKVGTVLCICLLVLLVGGGASYIVYIAIKMNKNKKEING